MVKPRDDRGKTDPRNNEANTGAIKKLPIKPHPIVDVTPNVLPVIANVIPSVGGTLQAVTNPYKASNIGTNFLKIVAKWDPDVNTTIRSAIEGVVKYPTKFESFKGEVISFSTKNEAKLFGFDQNEAIHKADKHFFDKATNQIIRGTNKYFDFKVTKLTNGNTVMEYTMLANNSGYTKKCINVIDNHGNKINTNLHELSEYKLSITPEGYIRDVKPFKKNSN